MSNEWGEVAVYVVDLVLIGSPIRVGVRARPHEYRELLSASRAGAGGVTLVVDEVSRRPLTVRTLELKGGIVDIGHLMQLTVTQAISSGIDPGDRRVSSFARRSRPVRSMSDAI